MKHATRHASRLTHHHALLLGSSALGLALACSGDDLPPSAPQVNTTVGQPNSDGSAVQTPDEDAPTPTSNDPDPASPDAPLIDTPAPTNTDDAPNPNGDPAPPTCQGELAFQALGAAFLFPTPLGLAREFNELAYDPSTHPLTLVAAVRNGAGSAAISASEVPEGNGDATFPEALTPEMSPVSVAGNHLSLSLPQPFALLRLKDTNGPVDIQLSNVTLDASFRSDCASAIVTLNAHIPDSEGSQELALGSGTTTLATLATTAETERTAGNGWGLSMTFTASTINFDFESL